MKKPIQFFVLLALGACFAFTMPSKSNTDSKYFNVVIDAGHGGKDVGCAHDDVAEKQITDVIAHKIMALNKDKEVVIHFTREGDNFVDLNKRVEAINAMKPDLVLSLHVNYSKEVTHSGIEFFIPTEKVKAEKASAYAEKLADKFEQKEYKVRSIKPAPMFVLKNSEAPAVMIQLGYLSNDKDRNYLTDKSKQMEMATIIANFLKEAK